MGKEINCPYEKTTLDYSLDDVFGNPEMDLDPEWEEKNKSTIQKKIERDPSSLSLCEIWR